MKLRRLPGVASRVPLRHAARAMVRAFGSVTSIAGTEAKLAQAFGAQRALLTDSGTSALVLALRLAAPGAVALPAYGCPDLVAAAKRAARKIRFYDVDPATLSPDIASLRAALERGVGAVVLVHFYGMAADVVQAAALCREYSATLIEDTAQGIGGALHGRPLGTTGEFAVLSFGRGKGMSAGGGGALLVREPDDTTRLALDRVGRTHSRGLTNVALAYLHSSLANPAVFAIPAAIPALQVGKMVFRDATEPARISRGSAALLALRWPEGMLQTQARRRIARLLLEGAQGADRALPRVLPGSEPGWLRFPMYVASNVSPPEELGVVRPYPLPLPSVMDTTLLASKEHNDGHPGAVSLCESLVTLPTHHWLTAGDLSRLMDWLQANAMAAVAATVPIHA